MQIVYKIKRGDGLFSNGRPFPSFSKQGKVWRRRCDLTAHVNLMLKNYRPRPETRWVKALPPRRDPLGYPYKDAVIVAFFLSQTDQESIDQP